MAASGSIAEREIHLQKFREEERRHELFGTGFDVSQLRVGIPATSLLQPVPAERRFPVRAGARADNYGSKYTGRYYGNAFVSLENALRMGEAFHVAYGHDLDGRTGKGTDDYGFYFSVPWRSTRLMLWTSRYAYKQEVESYLTNLEYRGKVRYTGGELRQIVHTGVNSITTASVELSHFYSRNFIDDVENELQRRRQTVWEAGINHRRFFGPAVVDVDLRYRRGIGAFGTLTAPEEPVGEGTNRSKIVLLDIRLAAPFCFFGQEFRFDSHWRHQWALNRLTPPDKFAIG
ncbi:MAG: ShlB/FhaC/HecB family hemolysin secretion/activation protein, partial [Planctomycetes bacterium]|nr:ShlB/FhaC/HecB family hemolysin secretion/activation protein [Planctomycetota bacterium]